MRARYKTGAMTRRALTLLAVCVAGATQTASAGAPASAEATPALWRKLSRALVVPQVSRAQTAAVAVDLATGQVVFQHNATRSLVPASNEKLAVTYAALVVLGPGFRSKTEVLGAGRLSAGIWRGNLILKGYGDATLSRSDLRALARRVRSAGIRRITGRVIADESFFDRRRTAPGWKSSFYLNECPPLSALVVDRGRTRGGLTLNPALAAGAAFSRMLRSRGIAVGAHAVTGLAPRSATPLAATLSAPLWKVLRFMDRESDNFTSEMLLKQLGGLYGARGSTPAGAAVVTRTLAADGIPLAGVRIVDGSGLSLLDRMTARALVAILQTAWSSPQLRDTLIGVLPVAGVNGTLRGRMVRPPARGRVVAKTGTTSRSSALSGYVNRRYAFSVLSNGYPVASWWAERAQDRFATALVRAR